MSEWNVKLRVPFSYTRNSQIGLEQITFRIDDRHVPPSRHLEIRQGLKPKEWSGQLDRQFARSETSLRLLKHIQDIGQNIG